MRAQADERIAIVGGGLAGLVAAYSLSRAGASVVLFEADARLGGQIHTERSDGYVIELGAEGFVARSEAVQHLADELGIGAELVGQAEERSFGYDAGKLLPLAPGEAATFLGFRVPRAELGKGIRTFARGMDTLVDALVTACARVEIRRSCAVRRLRLAGEGVELEIGDGTQDSFDRVLLAVTAASAARLLEPLVGAEATALRDSATLSSVTVSLGYSRAAIGHALDGTGFVVRHPEAHAGLRACTFTSSKFVDRAPESQASLRAFFRPDTEKLAQLDDRAWQELAHAQLAQILQIDHPPARAWVSRWANALPVHDAAHAQRVAALEARLTDSPIRLVGAAFHGAGIDAAVRSAIQAAAEPA